MSTARWLVAALALGGPSLANAAVRYARRPRLPEDNWGLRPLSGSKAEWLEELVADVRDVMDAYDMPASVGIGQAAIETGWGRAGRNNPWGLRGIGDVGSDLITTHEVFDPKVGAVKLTGQKFARFSSTRAAAHGYCRFLEGKRYREGHAWRNDPGAWLLWLWGVGYATATNYATSVVGTSRKAAVTLDDPTLAIPWTDRHQAIADELSTLKAGGARKARTRELLAL